MTSITNREVSSELCNDPGYLYRQARAYESGNGAEQDSEKAALFFMRAASMGYAPAKKVFAFDFDDKFHMGVSKARFRTILCAAEQGHPDAEFSIGARYRRGVDVSKDYDAAFYWFTRAYNHGHLDATYYLAAMYRKGRGTPANIPMFLQLLMESAEKGHAVANHALGKMYEKGEYVQCNLEKAFGYFLKSAEAGYFMSQYHVGQMYRDGIGTAQDPFKAIYWITKSARHYNIAWYTLGQMFEFGNGVKTDLKLAAEYYQKCARLDYYPSLLRLYEMYRDGIGVEKDAGVAEMYLRKLSGRVPPTCYGKLIGTQEVY